MWNGNLAAGAANGIAKSSLGPPLTDGISFIYHRTVRYDTECETIGTNPPQWS